MEAKTALVVEDDKAIQGFLRDALEHEGCQVLLEKDGEWALKALERRLPDVLVTDLLLPGLTGLELVRSLRSMPGGDEVPVVLMSGIYKTSRHKSQGQKLGARVFLEKPFTAPQLIKGLREAMGHDFPGSDQRQRRAPPPLGSLQGTDSLAGPETASERDEVERQAKRFRNARTARGNLSHKRFPEVLSQLYRWRATGALLLKRERVKKIVYLKDGYPIFVKSNLLSECLGRVLVREKMIGEAECEQSLSLMKKSKRQQGTVLIELGIISPHNLVYALQLQLEAKLFDIFRWPDGEYQFNAKINIPPQAVHLDMSLATIVYEGVRRGFQDRQLDDLIAPFEHSYLAVHPDPLHRFQDLSLESDERKLVALVDGRRTLTQIIERSGIPLRQARQLLYSLMAAEMIQPQQRRARHKDPLEMPPPRAARTTPPGLMASSSGELLSAPDHVLQPSSLMGLSVHELRARLTERARQNKKLNHFELLGVSKSAGDAEVRRAYFSLVRDVHRDRLPGNAPADARALAEQIEGALTGAYEALKDPTRRASYESALEQSALAGVTDDLGRILAAEGRFRRGQKALEKAAFDDAAGHFEEAVKLYPDEGDFHAHLGWALYKGASRDGAKARTAEEHIREGLMRNPRSDKGYLFLGQLMKETGRKAEAQQQFEQAIQCNPDCKQALRELRLITERRPARRG
jgi:CheY-like chemotaxis protein